MKKFYPEKRPTRTILIDGTSLLNNSYGNSIFVEERAGGHRSCLGDTTVVAFSTAAFAGEHGLGAGFVLLELQVFIDGKGVGHRLYVEVIGADEREGPVLLLQLLNHRADHLQRPFLAAVLFAVGDDGHKHMVAILNLSISLGDTFADSIVERCAATRAVGFPVQVLGLRGGRIVVVPSGMASVEGEQGDKLYLVRELLLHLANSLQGFVHTGESLFADDGHRTALVDNNQVVNSLSWKGILHNLCHNRYFLKW